MAPLPTLRASSNEDYGIVAPELFARQMLVCSIQPKQPWKVLEAGQFDGLWQLCGNKTSARCDI